MVGAGIEDVNHELVGGIYSQMLWGESFEEPADRSGASTAGTNGRPTWVAVDPLPAGCELAIENRIAAKTGAQSQAISGAGCGIANRGLDFGG